MQKILIILTLFLTSNASVAGECFISKQKFSVGFFNGVGNTLKQATKSSQNLKSKTHYPVTLYYNHTEGITKDLLEAYEQRLAEIPFAERAKEANGQKFLFYQFMNGATSKNDSPEIKAAINKFAGDVRRLERVASTRPITVADYTDHDRQLDSELQVTSRVALVAHSQGNLFANHVFESLSKTRQKRAGVIHVAPASVHLHGKYILSKTDMIVRPISTMPANITIPYNIFADHTGHGFSESYLAYPGSLNRIIVMIDEQQRLATPIGIHGDFNVKTMGQFVYRGVSSPSRGVGKISFKGGLTRYTDKPDMAGCQATITYDSGQFNFLVKRQFIKPGGFLRSAHWCGNGAGRINKVVQDESTGDIEIKETWESLPGAPSAASGEDSLTCRNDEKRKSGNAHAPESTSNTMSFTDDIKRVMLGDLYKK